MLSKIDYALPIYGHCGISLIRKISVPYHAAIRRSIRAFPTSRIKCLLAEAGLPSITSRVIDSTSRILAKYFETSNKILVNAFNNAISRKTQPRIPSALTRSISFAKKNFITLPRERSTIETLPPWHIRSKSFEDALLSQSKQNTPNLTFQSQFLETFAHYNSLGWNFIYTDGSKTSDYTSLAVINKNGDTITKWLLYPMCSIFTAEAFAIELAVNYAKKNKGKYMICTDSKSCITAIKSPNNANRTITSIRNSLITTCNKIKIMWIPGHAGITGNEIADDTAKRVFKSPTPMLKSFSRADLYNFIKRERILVELDDWKTQGHHYYNLNPKRLSPCYKFLSKRPKALRSIKARPHDIYALSPAD